MAVKPYSTADIDRSLPLATQEQIAEAAGLHEHVYALKFQSDGEDRIWLVTDWHSPIVVFDTFLATVDPRYVAYDEPRKLLAIAVENGRAVYRTAHYAIGPLGFLVGHLLASAAPNETLRAPSKRPL